VTSPPREHYSNTHHGLRHRLQPTPPPRPTYQIKYGITLKHIFFVVNTQHQSISPSKWPT